MTSHLVDEALSLGAKPIEDRREGGESSSRMGLTEEQVRQLKEALDESRVKQVSTGGRSADYLETYDIIDAANRIFGFDGWSFELIDVSPMSAANRDGESRGVLFVAKGKLTVGGVSRIDVGTNDVSYRRDSGEATPDSFETAIKGAVSDCLKRCFRTFGNQFGNSLYDKQRPKGPRQQRATPAATPPPAAPKKEKTVDDLLVWATTRHKLTPAAVFEICQVSKKEEITDLRDATKRIEAFVAGLPLEATVAQ